MAQPPKRPDPLAERISALPDLPKEPLGYGKQKIPRPDPELPKAVPRHEQTQVRGFPKPAPESAPGAPPRPPYKRHPSPNPAPVELAPESEPESLQAARSAALEAVAEQDRVSAAELAAAKAELLAVQRAVKPTDYKGIALVVTAIGGVLATVSASRCSPVPPAVLECPARVDELERKLKKTTATADQADTDLAEARKAWRKTDDKAEDALEAVAKLRRAVPRIEGVKPD